MPFECDHIELVSGFVIAVMSVMFMGINVQKDEEWVQYRKMRIILAVSYIVLSVSSIYSVYSGGSFDLSPLSASLFLIIGSYQALLFTATCMVFVAPGAATVSRIGTNVLRITIQGVILLLSLFYGSEILYKICFWLIVCIYVYKLVQYTQKFSAYYDHSFMSMASCDEIQLNKLRWVKKFFYSALIIGIINLIVVILPQSRLLSIAFCLIYTAYYVYFTLCMINYRIDFQFIIKAVYKASEEKEKPLLDASQISELKNRLDTWVAEKRYTERDILPERLAEELGTNRRALAWYFTTQLETTFRSWRLLLRIEEAKRLLTEDDVSTANVHELVGIADKSNFHKHFKKLTGLTPTEYKAQYKN